MKKFLRRAASVLAIVLVAIQLVPYGREHSNPTDSVEPQWDSPRTRDLAVRACFDCHSNLSRWPWYSHIAPTSWLVQRDVDEGREHLNFSEWNRPQKHADEAVEMVAEGEMPPWFYLPLHAAARLDAAESAELQRGLAATLGTGAQPEPGARD